MLNEHQHVDATQQDGVHSEEITRDDPLGLCGQELSPRRSGSAWRRVDTPAAVRISHTVDAAIR
jgi:hypothetical protein